MSSLLDEIAEQGQRIALAEKATKDMLKKLEEANLLLLMEVKERRLAEDRLRILCNTSPQVHLRNGELKLQL